MDGSMSGSAIAVLDETDKTALIETPQIELTLQSEQEVPTEAGKPQAEVKEVGKPPELVFNGMKLVYTSDKRDILDMLALMLSTQEDRAFVVKSFGVEISEIDETTNQVIGWEEVKGKGFSLWEKVEVQREKVVLQEIGEAEDIF